LREHLSHTQSRYRPRRGVWGGPWVVSKEKNNSYLNNMNVMKNLAREKISRKGGMKSEMQER